MAKPGSSVSAQGSTSGGSLKIKKIKRNYSCVATRVGRLACFGSTSLTSLRFVLAWWKTDLKETSCWTIWFVRLASRRAARPISSLTTSPSPSPLAPSFAFDSHRRRECSMLWRERFERYLPGKRNLRSLRTFLLTLRLCSWDGTRRRPDSS